MKRQWKLVVCAALVVVTIVALFAKVGPKTPDQLLESGIDDLLKSHNLVEGDTSPPQHKPGVASNIYRVSYEVPYESEQQYEKIADDVDTLCKGFMRTDNDQFRDSIEYQMPGTFEEIYRVAIRKNYTRPGDYEKKSPEPVSIRIYVTYYETYPTFWERLLFRLGY